MNIPINFLDDLFSRTVLFAQTTIDTEISTDRYMDRLKNVDIAITGKKAILESANGQYMLLMTINLLSRFCLKLDIVMPSAVKASLKHPFITDDILVRNLLDLVRKINPMIDVNILDTAQKRYDYVITIGEHIRDLGKTVCINSDGWTAYLNTEGNSTSWISHNINPIGAYSAACLGAAELFKSIFGNIRHKQRVGSLIFSAFDYCFMHAPLANPALPKTPSINEINFISMGAINSAALFTLCSFPEIQIAATIVEPENLDISNLNRYAFSLAEDAINKVSKIDSATNFARSCLKVKKSLKLPFENIGDNELDNAILAVVGVDNVESRLDVQKSNFAQILCGGTTGMGDIQISSYNRSGDDACLGCLYPDPLHRETMPTVSFVSIMSGVLMAGEIIKGSMKDYKPYRLKNNLNLSLLSSQYYQHRFMPKSDRCKIH